jgi:signal transduction histidine kinase
VAEAQRRVIAECMRIAHELYDVLVHHIAVVNAQAGVAQYLLETHPAAATKALHGITTNSRAALDELRMTLGLPRGEAEAGKSPIAGTDDRTPRRPARDLQPGRYEPVG